MGSLCCIFAIQTTNKNNNKKLSKMNKMNESLLLDLIYQEKGIDKLLERIEKCQQKIKKIRTNIK